MCGCEIGRGVYGVGVRGERGVKGRVFRAVVSVECE